MYITVVDTCLMAPVLASGLLFSCVSVGANLSLIQGTFPMNTEFIYQTSGHLSEASMSCGR